MFDSRVMETEFLNRPDSDLALTAVNYRFSDTTKTGVAPVWWPAAMILFWFPSMAKGRQWSSGQDASPSLAAPMPANPRCSIHGRVLPHGK